MLDKLIDRRENVRERTPKVLLIITSSHLRIKAHTEGHKKGHPIGLFDVVVIRDMSLLKAPKVAISLFTKRVDESASIDIYRTNHLIIEREKEDYAQVDGELIDLGRRIEITIQKQQLPILVPQPKS